MTDECPDRFVEKFLIELYVDGAASGRPSSCAILAGRFAPTTFCTFNNFGSVLMASCAGHSTINGRTAIQRAVSHSIK